MFNQKVAAYSGFAVIILSMGLGLGLAHPEPSTTLDQNQPRLDQAAPVPQGDAKITQTLIASHNGLSSLELLAVVPPEAASQTSLTLKLLDAHQTVIASAAFSNFKHNDSLRLSFSPVANSTGQAYTLLVEGGAENAATVWAYSLDGYPRGSLINNNGVPLPGDLRFTTSYTYLWADILRDAAAALRRLLTLALPLWLVLFAPGLLLLNLLVRLESASYSFWLRLGVALGLSLSILPVAWLWITLVGLSFSAVTLSVSYALVGVVVIGQGLRQCFSKSIAASFKENFSIHHLAMGLILILSVVSRLLAIRDLAFPAWVDSSHHFAIARLLAESGRVPADYLPLLPIHRFIYHFGFHALAATFHWLTSLSLLQTFLFLGQVLNGLMPLAAYAFVAGLTARPRAGLVAAFFVGLVSFFPGYYLSWGRYTQLTGLLIIAPALALVWQLVIHVETARFPARSLGKIITLALLSAGLLLSHYRVFVFFVIFTWVAVAVGNRGGWKGVILAGAGGFLLTFPWLVRLGLQAGAPLLSVPARLTAPAGYNAFPINYFQSSLEKGWLILAGLMAAGGVLRRERAVIVTVGWVVVAFALLNIGPGTWLVNNNAWAITLFLPGSLLLGWGIDRWLTAAQGMIELQEQETKLWIKWIRRGVGFVMLASVTTVAAYAGIKGLLTQINIANPGTTLATAEDAQALDWITQHVPVDGIFLVNGWEWQKGSWAGSDGGAWIWPLTGYQTTLPPLDYVYQRDWLNKVNVFNEQAAQVKDANAPETLALLRSAGVTHVFIGAKGSTLKPEMFANSPNYHLLYTNGAAWVFEVK